MLKYGGWIIYFGLDNGYGFSCFIWERYVLYDFWFIMFEIVMVYFVFIVVNVGKFFDFLVYFILL